MLVTARLSRLTLPLLPEFCTTPTVLTPALRVTGTETVDQVSQEAVVGSVRVGPAAPLMVVDRVRVVVWPSPPAELA